MTDAPSVHPAWLPAAATTHLAGREAVVDAHGPLVATVLDELRGAGLRVTRRASPRPEGAPGSADHVLAILDAPAPGLSEGADLDAGAGSDADVGSNHGAGQGPPAADKVDDRPLGPEDFVLTRVAGVTVVMAGGDAGLLYGWFELLRLGKAAVTGDLPPRRHSPALGIRMLDHWDNIDVHPVMGQVERGYAGGSIFYQDGKVRADLARVGQYARLLAATGVNRVAINNVNVHAREARLLTDDLGEVARIAAQFRPWGIQVHLSVNFASPVLLGGLDTADPHDERVIDWWAETARRVYAAIPDFGGFVVKADSEGQPGPKDYGRDHADGANVLARAVAPHGGLVHWRAFVYDHRQDWRDRSTDRARAAFDHFTPLDGRFDPNVVLQVKHGPMDFQVREPVSPVIGAMPRTRVGVEFQVTQEYTGQQRHVCYLAPMWREALGFGFGPDASAPSVADIAAGAPERPGGGIVAVANVGDDTFWTGHPLAQANLYAFGRLAWNPQLSPGQILDEWIALTFGRPAGEVDPDVRATLHEIMDDSWATYESYTAPLGVGFMVRPGHHYGPDVDGYEYTPWGTYHFADRDGIGVDRSVATGTGYAGQYPPPWRDVFESPASCPDELLLFFHHVPYTHVLHSGVSVIQHIYDTHAEGADRVEDYARAWQRLAGKVPADVFERVSERLAEQVRSAGEWRDQLRSYFFRKSGVPDATGRVIF